MVNFTFTSTVCSVHTILYTSCVISVHTVSYIRFVSVHFTLYCIWGVSILIQIIFFFVKLILVSSSHSFPLLLRFCNRNVVCFSAYSDLCYMSDHFHARSCNNFNAISWRANLNLWIVYIFFIFLLCHFQIYAWKICSEETWIYIYINRQVPESIISHYLSRPNRYTNKYLC